MVLQRQQGLRLSDNAVPPLNQLTSCTMGLNARKTTGTKLLSFSSSSSCVSSASIFFLLVLLLHLVFLLFVLRLLFLLSMCHELLLHMALSLAHGDVLWTVGELGSSTYESHDQYVPHD